MTFIANKNAEGGEILGSFLILSECIVSSIMVVGKQDLPGVPLKESGT